jgi:hypothetical protein
MVRERVARIAMRCFSGQVRVDKASLYHSSTPF